MRSWRNLWFKTVWRRGFEWKSMCACIAYIGIAFFPFRCISNWVMEWHFRVSFCINTGRSRVEGAFGGQLGQISWRSDRNAGVMIKQTCHSWSTPLRSYKRRKNLLFRRLDVCCCFFFFVLSLRIVLFETFMHFKRLIFHLKTKIYNHLPSLMMYQICMT